jgi:hypothetical protein
MFFHYYYYLEDKIKNSPELMNDELYSRMSDFRIPKIVDKALREGFITPETYVFITMELTGNNIYGAIGFNYDWDNEKVTPTFGTYGKKITEEDVVRINNNRESIGLPPLSFETEEDILNFSWNKNFPFKELKKARTLPEWEYLSPEEKTKIDAKIISETSKKYKEDRTKNHFILPSID